MSKSQRFFVFIFYFQTPVFLTNALIHSCFFFILWIWVPFVSLAALSDGVTDTSYATCQTHSVWWTSRTVPPPTALHGNNTCTWEFSRCLIIVWCCIFYFSPFDPSCETCFAVRLIWCMAELISVEKVKGIWGKKKKGKLLSFWVFFILSAFIKEKVEKGNMEMDPFENKDCERVKLKSTET